MEARIPFSKLAIAWSLGLSVLAIYLAINLTTTTTMMLRKYETVSLDNERLNRVVREQQDEIVELKANISRVDARTNWYIVRRSGIAELEHAYTEFLEVKP